MSATSAGLILLWIVVIVLLFAMAGLRQQVRRLQYGAALADASPQSSRTVRRKTVDLQPVSGRSKLALLLVTEGCAVCHEVTPWFIAEASTNSEVDFAILTRAQNGAPADVGRARHVIDARLFNDIDPGWQPALIIVDADGSVESVEPVGSKDAIDFELTKLRGAQARATRRT